MNLEKYHCSKHGDVGQESCNECWARLADFLSAMEQEQGIDINIVGSKKDLDKLKL